MARGAARRFFGGSQHMDDAVNASRTVLTGSSGLSTCWIFSTLSLFSLVSWEVRALNHIYQVLKYTAKLRLLEYGLLDAVGIIDTLHVQSKKKNIDDDDDDDAEEDGDEPLAAFTQRIFVFLQANLAKARIAGVNRDSYKDALVFQARKDLILDFQKIAMVKKCQNPQCGAYVTYTPPSTLD
jgi:hypothetical protein